MNILILKCQMLSVLMLGVIMLTVFMQSGVVLSVLTSNICHNFLFKLQLHNCNRYRNKLPCILQDFVKCITNNSNSMALGFANFLLSRNRVRFNQKKFSRPELLLLEFVKAGNRTGDLYVFRLLTHILTLSFSGSPKPTPDFTFLITK